MINDSERGGSFRGCLPSGLWELRKLWFSGSSGPNVLRHNNPFSAAVCTFANACTQVTICQPSTSTCQTIADVLVDTGSSGLRIFASAVTITLPSSNLGECMYFGSGTEWGRVHTVDVILARNSFSF
jgi:hypothetical protein